MPAEKRVSSRRGYEVVDRSPLVVLSTVHDVNDVSELVKALAVDHKDACFLAVVVDEGDVNGLLAAFSPTHEVVFTTRPSSRGVVSESLLMHAVGFLGQDFVYTVERFEDAIDWAIDRAATAKTVGGLDGDAVLILGSAATVTAARTFLRQRAANPRSEPPSYTE